MFGITGKYNTAYVYADEIENESYSQIQNLLNNEVFSKGRIAIMPDTHAGKGSVIGFTAPLSDKIIPNIIGVDINCGVLGYNLGKNRKLKFDKLDKFIRNNIPAGSGQVNESIDHELLTKIFPLLQCKDFEAWEKFAIKIKEVCLSTNQNYDYVLSSLGSLGSGNHFHAIEEDEDGNLWFLTHSGSRNFGLSIATFHQNVAEENNLLIPKEEYQKMIEEIRSTHKGKGIEAAIQQLRNKNKKKAATGLEFLSNQSAQNYFHDAHIAQIFAELNRLMMVYKIINFYDLEYDSKNRIQTNHNYIDFEHGIMRKGAVSAQKDEIIFIPINMEYGTLLCRGKGNPDWNYSAPHGAGRLMSRSKAKSSISLEKYQYIMKKSGIWSSCVSKDTIDEAPQAYKKPEMIIKAIEPTAEIISRLTPRYNFKAS